MAPKNQLWNCTHLRHPTDEQLGLLDILNKNNLPSSLNLTETEDGRDTERPTGGMDGQNCQIQKLNEYNNRLLSSNLSEECS